MDKLIINGELVDLNNYINAERANRFIASKIKKEQTEIVYWSCLEKRTRKVVEYPVKILFKWYTKDSKKDADNISFTKKFILDGMVEAKVLENDSRKFVNGFEDLFFVDKINPRVEVEFIKL